MDEAQKWKKRFERERIARKEAEVFLEDKSLELFKANEELTQHSELLESAIEQRTQELEENQQGLVKLNQVLLKLGIDFESNIDQLVSVGGKILQADFAVYHRLTDGSLFPLAHWAADEVSQLGPTLQQEVTILARQVIELGKAGVVSQIVSDENDSTNDDLRSFEKFAGIPVIIRGRVMGVLSVIYIEDTQLDLYREQVIEIVASAIAMEEESEATQRELDEQESRFAEVFERSMDGIIVHDDNGKIVDVNQKAVEMLGYSSETLARMTLPDLHPQVWLPICKQAVSQVMSEGAHRFEAEFLPQTGEAFLAEISASRFDLGGKTYIQGIVRDITERRQHENERKQAAVALANAKEDAESANAAKSVFLASMSHEIRTPLNGILGFAEILKSTSLDKKQKEYLDTISASGDVLLNVINDILDLSRIEDGKIDLNIQPTDPSECIQQTARILDSVAKTKGLEILTSIDPGADKEIQADPHRLRQVLINLTNNGLKFTSEGTVTMSVKPSEGLDSNRLFFEIEDTGIGISPEDQKKLFKPFSQVGDSDAKRQGTGLGLSICKSLVEAMGGTITCESIIGQGSTFKFDIPESPPAKSFEKLKVAVTSRSPINCQLLVALLERKGHETQLLQNEETIAEALADKTINLLFADSVQWFNFIQTQNDQFNARKGVALVFDASSTELQEVREFGINNALGLPLTPEKLDQTISLATR